MGFSGVRELLDYWEQFPPLHVLFRGYVGYNPMPKFEDMNMIDVGKAVMSVTKGKRAQKLSTADARTQAIFADLKNWKPDGR